MARTPVIGPAEAPVAIERRSEAIRALGVAIATFIAALRTESMPREVADELTRALRTGRYLDEARLDAARQRHAVRRRMASRRRGADHDDEGVGGCRRVRRLGGSCGGCAGERRQPHDGAGEADRLLRTPGGAADIEAEMDPAMAASPPPAGAAPNPRA